MVDWNGVVDDLAAAGYPGFEFDADRTAVPGLSGEWVVGSVSRTGALAQSSTPLYLRLLDAIPGGAAVDADPERAPGELRAIAEEYGVESSSSAARPRAFASLSVIGSSTEKGDTVRNARGR